MASPVRFKPNAAFPRAYREASRKLAEALGKTDPEGLAKLARQSAARFVRNVADVTPPSIGTADQASKQRGENAILGDLLKIALPVTVEGVSKRRAREALASASDLLAAHERARAGASGRVNPRNRKEKLLVAQADFLRVLKQLQAKVGFLAAALNAAAAQLGISLPAWIKRHGNKYGIIRVIADHHRIKTHIEQQTPYADNVAGYKRRWDFAAQKEIRSLLAQAKAVLKRKAHRAGFRIK